MKLANSVSLMQKGAKIKRDINVLNAEKPRSLIIQYGFNGTADH